MLDLHNSGYYFLQLEVQCIIGRRVHVFIPCSAGCFLDYKPAVAVLLWEKNTVPRLISRADKLSRTGGWKHSIGLQEVSLKCLLGFRSCPWLSLHNESAGKLHPTNVATSPAVHGHRIGRVDSLDRTKHGLFSKKPFYLAKINPHSKATRRPLCIFYENPLRFLWNQPAVHLWLHLFLLWIKLLKL
jgi:hypothetical protein